MRLNTTVGIAITLGTIDVVFAGCSAIHNAQQSAATGFHSGFRSSFKSSFMKSCTVQVGTTEALCGCIESTLERENTDDQLIKMASDAAETTKELAAAARTCRGGAQPAMDPARINAYVTPYYDSTGPSIRVGAFSSGLASSNSKQVFATTGAMKRQWQRLSFPQLYVGAIRLYDAGYRNEAVYWFYTAQYRARQVSVLLDPTKIGSVGDPGFELQAAGSAFMQTAGTWINGYAFGNPNRLIATVRRVQREGRRIGDLKAIYPNVAFIDRRRWPAANARLADGMDSLVTYLEAHKAQIAQQRAANGTAAMFAHLTSK